MGELGDRSAEAILIWRPCLNEAVAQRPREQLISRTFVCLPTARARTREYGAVAVVSGRLVGKTQTATLFVEERYQNFDQPAAYAMAFALAAIAVVILLAITALRPEDHR